jgi:hypothetical protein
MTGLCSRCGVGRRIERAACDWCGAPLRARIPCWIVLRRGLSRSGMAAALRRRSSLAAGIGAGIVVHLLVTALAVAAGKPALWEIGLFWPAQWWWALAPESVQPWGFAVLQGVVYGALAGWVAGWRAGSSRGTARREARSGLDAGVSSASVTGLVAFVVTGWDSPGGMEQRLVAAAGGAVVGRLTTILLSAGSTKTHSSD